MKKFVVYNFIFLAIISGVYAQVNTPGGKTSFSGFIKDSVSGLPLPKLTVHCKRNNTSAADFFTVADSLGFLVSQICHRGNIVFMYRVLATVILVKIIFLQILLVAGQMQ